MKRYSAYKDSGIDLIGEIPEHWMKLRGDSLFSLSKEIITKEGLENQAVFHYSIPSIQTNGDGQYEEGNTIDSNKFIVYGYEILFSKLNPRKETIIVTQARKGILQVCSTEFLVLKPTNVHLKFGFYLMKCEATKERVCSHVQSATRSHQRANPEDIIKLWHYIPTYEEQEAIANYLDDQLSKIDGVVLQKKQLITLLNEEKAAIINNAVKRGVTEDVTMVETGIQLIGAIPAHWKVKRLKFISSSISVGLVINPSSYFDDDGEIPMLTGKNVSPFNIDINDVKRISKESNDELIKTQVHEGDIVVVRVGYPGLAAVVSKEMDGFNCASMMIVRKGGFNSDFLCMVMNSEIGMEQVKVVEYGAAQKQFNISHAIEFRFPIPPLDEQDKIQAYVKKELNKVDNIIDKVLKEIELLTEYKTSLIYEVVTGKLKVDIAVNEAIESYML